MRGNTSRAILGGLLTVSVLVLCACYFDSLGGGNTATATLTVSMKQPAAAVTSIALVVSGPGMSTIARTLAVTDTEVVLDVPAGQDRTFTVLVNTVSVTFKGETTVDLAGGQSTAVSLNPELYATQIIIPDALNGRIIQISDMGGAGWATRYGPDIEFPGTFRPYDIDFDGQGRIYVANYGFSTGEDVVVRIDSIADTSFETIVQTGFPSEAVAIAIDRSDGYLYFAVDGVLKRSDLDGAGVTTLATAGIGIIRGMDLDADGFLYVAGQPAVGGSAVFRYDPNTQVVTDTVVSGLSLYPWDVLVKGTHLYVATNEVYGENKIMRFTTGMVFTDELTTKPGTGEPLYGPHRFVAILNRKLTIIDDGNTSSSPFNLDRLVSIDDVSGSNWQEYGEYGTGTGQFEFFEHYVC